MPYLASLEFFRQFGAREKSFSKLSISYVARISINKVRICQHFLFDVIEYIKYTDKRYMHGYCLH